MPIAEMLLFSAALSIDALGIGAACSLSGIRIPLRAKLMICLLSVGVTAMSVFIGSVAVGFVPPWVGKLTGSLLLGALGVYTLVGALRQDPSKPAEQDFPPELLGRPELCDRDHSLIVDMGEACAIGAALSLDSLAAGFGAGMSGGGLTIPVLCGMFQLLFLIAGDLTGRHLSRTGSLGRKCFSILSGGALLLLAVCRIFAE